MTNTFATQGLASKGFAGFQLLRRLPRGCSHVPSRAGVYAVSLECGTGTFLPQSVGGHLKENDPTVPISRLEEKRIDGVETLYVGRAIDLRKRVDLFARYGRGEPVAHRGGRFLWQIAQHDELRIAWKLDPDPVGAEADLLEEFEATFGQLPFANLIRGSRVLVAA